MDSIGILIKNIKTPLLNKKHSYTSEKSISDSEDSLF